MAVTHPLLSALSPITFILMGCFFAVPPFLLHLLLHPFDLLISTDPLPARAKKAKQRFFFYVWRNMSPLLDPGDRDKKSPLLARCYGTVLEIGAGVGGNIIYYNRAKVQRLILVEPNAHMHPKLRAAANAAGYVEADGSLLLLGCGGAASDEKALTLAGVGPESVDSIAVIHVLCGIPAPASAVEMYRRILKPGGTMVFYEHVQSEDAYIASWQTWYTKGLWQTLFDGCCLDRPTGAWIMGGPAAKGTGKEIADGKGGAGGRWKESFIGAPEDQGQFDAVPHVMGYVVKV